MPRKGRMILPNMPHHIVQRGHNRNVVFVEQRDYQYYIENLVEWKAQLGIKVYGYCLMTNHIHLIVEPGEIPSDVGSLMKRLAGRQTRFANKLEGRTGSLWESRYKISPIETDAYLLQCCRYVDLNPVKARMVEHASHYPWSSCAAKVGHTTCNWLDLDPMYQQLGNNHAERAQRYAEFIGNVAAANKEHRFIQNAVERNQLTGGNRFIAEVEARTGLRIEHRGRGRPTKKY